MEGGVWEGPERRRTLWGGGAQGRVLIGEPKPACPEIGFTRPPLAQGCTPYMPYVLDVCKDLAEEVYVLY